MSSHALFGSISRVPRRVVSVVAVVSMVVGAGVTGLVLSPSAYAAADQPTQDVTAGLNQVATFVGRLAAVGEMGEQIPTLGLIPGSSEGIGLADALSETLSSAPLGGDFDGAENVGDVVDALNEDHPDISHNRTVAIDAGPLATADGVDSFPVTFTWTRVVHPGLDIKSTNQPFTFSSGTGVDVTLTTTLDLDVNYRASDRFFWLTKTDSSPSLTLDAVSSGFHPDTARGSIGILGVQLEGDADPTKDYAIQAHLASTFADPNNDGKLAFTEADGTNGELHGDGAPAGIVSIDWAGSPAVNTAGGTLHLIATPSDLIGDLPAANATVQITAPDLSAAEPVTASYTAGALDALKAFERLTPKDLADALGQLSQLLTTVQMTHLDAPGSLNLDLPFMKGTLADAIQVNESVRAFLDGYVEQIPTDPADATKTVGKPRFSSIQELLAALDAPDDTLVDLPSGSAFTIGGADYDGTAQKLSFTLGISRDAPAAQPLDESAADLTDPTGANTTYQPTSMTDSDAHFTSDLAGRTVIAGAYRAAIKTVSGDGHTLTLDPAPLTDPDTDEAPASYWQGATDDAPHPADGTPYSVNSADPQTGLVQLGNALKNASGLTNINASIPQASVTPSYSVSLPIVLDLTPPTSTTPQTVENPDGSTQVVNELPVPIQRIKLHTGDDAPLFTLDAPIDTEFEADATVGFLGVHATGSLVECTTDTFDDSDATDPACGTVGDTHLVSVNLLTPPTGARYQADADGDISLPNLVGDLVSPDPDVAPSPEDVLDATVNGEAHAAIQLSVPGADAFFPTDHIDITVDMADIRDPGDLDVGGTDFDQLTKLSPFRICDPTCDLSELDPKALFDALLNALSALDEHIGELGGASGDVHDALNTPIPLLGASVQQLIRSGVSGGGDDVTYGSTTITLPDETTKDVGTLTDNTDGVAFDDSLIGRAITAGTVAGVVGDVTDSHTLQLTDVWSPAPQPGTTYQVEDALHAAISQLQADSADSLQEMLNTVIASLGGDSGATFSVDDSQATPVLHLDLDWDRSLSFTAPVQFKLGDFDLAGTSGHGSIKLDVDGHITANLRFPLSADAVQHPLDNLTIDPASGINVVAEANLGDDSYLEANAGPLAIALGDPSADDTNVEAHARLGLDLHDGTDTEPVTLDDYVGNLGVDLNNGVDPVTCDGADNEGVDLAVCAALPIYTSSDGGQHWNLLETGDLAKSSILVRLPQKTGTNLSDLTAQLDPTGNFSGTTPKIYADPDVFAKIASAYLDLSSLNDGLLGYLKFAEQALNLASAGGKLPLVGSDLQQGADFIGKVRAQITSVLGSGDLTMPDAGAIRSKLNEVKDKLSTAGVLPASSPFTIGITCTTTLAPATDVHAVEHHNDGTIDHTYEYAVVAVRDSDGTGRTVISNTSNDAQNVAASAFDGTHYNTVNWTTSTYADHYEVLRRVKVGTGSFGNFEFVAKVGDTNTYDDHNKTTMSYAGAPTERPKLKSCPDNVPGSEVDGITVATDLGAGSINNPAACDAGCVHTTPLSVGVPGLSFKAVEDGGSDNGITAKIGWKLHLKFGLDRTHGFYVATQDHGAGDAAGKSGPELQVGLSLDLPDSLLAQLAFLNIHIEKSAGVTDPAFAGAFTVDLKNPGGDTCSAASPCDEAGDNPDADEMLTIADIQNASSIGDFVKPVLSARALLDWQVKADTTVGAALPGISARFLLDAQWSSDAPDADVLQKLEFDHVSIDPGEFVGSVLGDMVNQIASVLKPIQPILDTIQAPIPVLSDLSHAVGGDDVTIASLANTFSTIAGGPDIEPFLDVVFQVNDLAKHLSAECGPDESATFCIDIGSFDLNKQIAQSQPNTPDLATTPNFIQPKNLPDSSPLDEINARSDGNFSGTGHDDKHPGFSFPALEDPTQLFQLLLGHDVTLAEFDSGPLALGFSFSESFGPVYAPPPVNVVISGSAGVAVRIVAGFDTYGIRKAVETGKLDAGVLDSLYFKTTDDSGKLIPVVQFTGSIAAGAEVSAVIIKAGIVGGIQLTVSFYWHDPDNDGKFRFSEFLATALQNPICLFDVGGELSLFIKVYITIGFDPFSVSFDFTLVNIKLLDFSISPNCQPPPPRLGGVKDGVLYLYAGKFATNSARGEPWGTTDAKEVWVIRKKDDGGQKITVNALGIQHTFTQSSIDTVVFDGRDYDGELQVLFQGTKDADGETPWDLKTVVFGGDAGDTIKTGSGASFVDGGGGDDHISTGDRPDPVNTALDAATVHPAMVAGGPGADVITTGNATDWVAGDSALTFTETSPSMDGYDTTLTDTENNAAHGSVTLTNVVNPIGIDHPKPPVDADTDGKDLLTTGIGGGEIWGGGQDDKIGTSEAGSVADANPGNDNLTPQPVTVVGGNGNDQIASGSAADFIYTNDKTDIGADEFGNGPASELNLVDTGTGEDTVYGSNGEDDVTVHTKTGQHATIYGGGSNDVLDGGDGTDTIYGGPGDDYLIAQPATVDKDHTVTDQLGTAYQVKLLPENPVSTSSKTLVGGGGSDRLYGGDGTSTLFGDHDTFFHPLLHLTLDDPCESPGPADSDDPIEHPIVDGPDSNQDKKDLILGGDGVDTIQAGGGDDWVFAKGDADLVCGEGGADTIDAGADDDSVWAGSGGDTVYGQAGLDALYGNDGNDNVYGGADDDVIEGNDNVDRLFGGADNDTIVGGTRHDGRADDDDFLYGDTGADVLIGDNGDPDSADGPVFDLADSDDTSLGGHDTVFGGADPDQAFGGLENDTVYGGGDNDYLEGNPGVDTISGETGADDITGGSAQLPGGDPTVKDAAGYPDAGDILSGGSADDVVIGDNGTIANQLDFSTADAVMQGRTPALTVGRSVTLYDLGYSPDSANSGEDEITGDEKSDVIYGQGAVDTVHGNDGEDYVEGGQAGDELYGDADQDDIVGGSLYVETGSGYGRTGQLDGDDTISGGPDADVVLGDNGSVDRVGAASNITKQRSDTDALPAVQMVLRHIELYDLRGTTRTDTSGRDVITGDGGSDVILAQAAADRVLGGADGDYAEGGPARDWVEGNGADDDLLGGSSTIHETDPGDETAAGQPDAGDAVFGNAGDDLITGDNAVTDRSSTPSRYLFRIGSNNGTLETQRSLRLLDRAVTAGDFLTTPSTDLFGADQLSGGGGVDVIFGQDGADAISGGGDDDYAEGNGADDTMYGDRTLDDVGLGADPTEDTFPGSASGDADASEPNGQDDLIGGSSVAQFRDGDDQVHGDGAADYLLGDNGTAVRDILDGTTLVPDVTAADGLTGLTNRVYAKRYPETIPAGAAYVRHGDTPSDPTRFCPADAAGTPCEPDLATGRDTLWGDGGEDTVYGQDDNDHLYGDTGAQAKPDGQPLPASVDDGGAMADPRNDDDLYGELGDDVIWGEAGDDAAVGDRGGVVDQYQDGSNAAAYRVDDTQVPQIHYRGFLTGSVTRQVDLIHDVNGDAFLGSGSDAPMSHRGDLQGGNDRIRGGAGHDSLHGGWGDDLVNGDSGGDVVYGDDGADVLWGGKGSDDPANLNDRGGQSDTMYDTLVDYLFGGKGATSGPSVASDGDLGSDIIDWRPRGVYGVPGLGTCSSKPWPQTFGNGKGAVTEDPCAWFEMTDIDDTTDANNQHHQGIDWIYGGWDRDVLQADVADEGPNMGDRLLDWTGAYNLYTHCNAAYGGFNDVRQFSPDMQDFLQKFAYSTGAGQTFDDVIASGTSAYDELALVYQPDIRAHGSGPDFPTTPGHFDNPNACAP